MPAFRAIESFKSSLKAYIDFKNILQEKIQNYNVQQAVEDVILWATLFTDKNILKDKIKDPIYYTEFMGMLIDMMKNKINDNIDIPQEVKETTNEYMNENNFVKKFLDAYIEITNNKDDRIKKTELYALYKTNTDDPLTNTKWIFR
jgi:hypothetical protein